jgi:Putative lumazine-binding
MPTEQERPVHAGTPIDDHDAIAATLQMYIDGSAQGDAAKLTEAFHPDAQMYGAVGDQRYDEPITEYIKLVTETPSDADGTFRGRITSIVQTGDAAGAILVEEGFWGAVSFVDFFTLARIEGRWRIVNKTFAHTGGELPAPE